MANAISESEWKSRYARCLMERGGMDLANATGAADAGYEMADEWLTPEDAATEEMTYWTNDL